MKQFEFGNSKVSQADAFYTIAEIGNNHQGELDTALRMIKVAAGDGAHAVKFQKRDNRALFTKAMYTSLTTTRTATEPPTENTATTWSSIASSTSTRS